MVLHRKERTQQVDEDLSGSDSTNPVSQESKIRERRESNSLMGVTLSYNLPIHTSSLDHQEV